MSFLQNVVPASLRSQRSQGTATSSGAQVPPAWDRICNVTAYQRPGASPMAAANPQFSQTIGNAVVVEGGGAAFKIHFSIKKNLGKQPNTCEIELVNLAPETRDFYTTKPLRIDIGAGHNGVPRLLWTGDLRFGYSRHDGTDWITKLEVSDGLQAFALARMNRSYKSPVRVDRVLKDAAASMGLTVTDAIANLPIMQQPLSIGVAMQGPTRDVLSQLLAPYGYNWSIQNGVLQILRDIDTRPGAAVLVNQAAGLVGSPEMTAPRNPAKSLRAVQKSYRGAEVKFRTLLWPELMPGGLCQLQSQTVTGTFKMTDVAHDGDTRDVPWYTDVTARPLTL